jgi:hypothetical protein
MLTDSHRREVPYIRREHATDSPALTNGTHDAVHQPELQVREASIQMKSQAGSPPPWQGLARES